MKGVARMSATPSPSSNRARLTRVRFARMLRSQWDCPVAPQQQCAAACCPPPTGPSLIGVSAAGTRELGRWSGLLWAGCVEHAAAAALGVAVSVAPAAPVDFGRRPLALVVRRAAGVEQAGYAELFRSRTRRSKRIRAAGTGPRRSAGNCTFAPPRSTPRHCRRHRVPGRARLRRRPCTSAATGPGAAHR